MPVTNADIQSQRGVASERGVALIIVLLLSSVLAALTMTLTLSGQTHVKISQNHEMAARARAAAEAGLNHGIEVTTANLRLWQANGFANTSAAMSAMLRGPDNQSGTSATDADNGSLEGFGVPRPPARVTFVAGEGTFYEVRLFDEDDAARGLTLPNADQTRINENGNTVLDSNSRIIVRAIGYAPSDTRVVLEAHVSPVPLPAIVANGNLTISGNPSIAGTMGSVHANSNLAISGSPTVSQNATASANYLPSGGPTVQGDSGGGRPTQQIPPVNAADHLAVADFILTSDGRLVQQATGLTLCSGATCGAVYGWVPDATGWRVSGNTLASGTYYVQGTATISGNPGTAASPISISIIAEGSIDISGNPDFRPDAPEVLFVTNGDLSITGGLTIPFNVEGQILVREQIMIAGHPTLYGQIVVENATNNSTLVTDNQIAGNPSITYNGLVGGGGTLNVTGWREMR
jgi:cytoskeletal protein CcmA (bactofilin family)